MKFAFFFLNHTISYHIIHTIIQLSPLPNTHYTPPTTHHPPHNPTKSPALKVDACFNNDNLRGELHRILSRHLSNTYTSSSEGFSTGGRSKINIIIILYIRIYKYNYLYYMQTLLTFV